MTPQDIRRMSRIESIRTWSMGTFQNSWTKSRTFRATRATCLLAKPTRQKFAPRPSTWKYAGTPLRILEVD